MSEPENIKALCRDWADDHTHLQELCRQAGCTDFEVYGDSYGTPGIQCLADLLFAKLQESEAAVAEMNVRLHERTQAFLQRAVMDQRELAKARKEAREWADAVLNEIIKTSDALFLAKHLVKLADEKKGIITARPAKDVIADLVARVEKAEGAIQPAAPSDRGWLVLREDFTLEDVLRCADQLCPTAEKAWGKLTAAGMSIEEKESEGYRAVRLRLLKINGQWAGMMMHRNPWGKKKGGEA